MQNSLSLNIYEFNSKVEIPDIELIIPSSDYYYFRLSYFSHIWKPTNGEMLKTKSPFYCYTLEHRYKPRMPNVEIDDEQVKIHHEYLRLKYS